MRGKQLAMSFQCPAKIMLAGEYAVVNGSSAIVLAVDRYAVATLSDREQPLSEFTAEVALLLSNHYGPTSEQAKRASRVTVDTSGFRCDVHKLGLGSSAAATVAAVAAALGPPVDVSTIHQFAAMAHRNTQARLGSPGSGADVACSSFGGCIEFAPKTQTATPIRLPTDLHLVFPWTGHSASTTELLGYVRRFQNQAPAHYQALCKAIGNTATQLAKATSAAEAIKALRVAGSAVAELGKAAGVALWLSEHSQLQTIAEKHQGIVKPTGAGGGDLALAAFSSEASAQAFRAQAQAQGFLCPSLQIDEGGVRQS